MQLASSNTAVSGNIDFDEFENGSLGVLNYPLKDDHRFKCELYECDIGTSKSVWETDARAGLPVQAL